MKRWNNFHQKYQHFVSQFSEKANVGYENFKNFPKFV